MIKSNIFAIILFCFSVMALNVNVGMSLAAERVRR